MNSLQRLGLATGLLTSLLATAAHYQVSGRQLGFFSAAHAQPGPGEPEKKKQQQQQQQKPPPPKAPPPPPKAPPPPPKATPPAPPPPRVNMQQPPPGPPPAMKKVGPPPGPQGPAVPGPGGQPPAFQKNFGQPTPGGPAQPQPPPRQAAPVPKGPPGAAPPSPPNGPGPGFPPKGPAAAGPGAPGPGFPPKGPAAAGPGGPGPGFLPKGPAAAGPGGPGPGFLPKGPAVSGPGAPAPGLMPKRLDQVLGKRQERVEDGGRRRVIVEPGNRTIVRQDNRMIIRHDEGDRFRFGARDVRTNRRPDGLTETFFLRPDGSRVITVTDGGGRIVRRYRRDPSGREVNFIDNRRFFRNAAIGVGVGLLGAAVILNLPRPVIDIPRDRYIVDYDQASDDDLYETLIAPPLMPMERPYSLEEIRDNYSLRERVRSIDLDNINFEFGSFEVTPDQYGKLGRIARAIQRVLERRPGEVYLIEGHTDAVGSDEDNLSLSDRRAEAVAQVLTEQFGVPPENLVTQGYGKQFLKVDTPEPERRNRRVTIRAISPLMGDQTSGRQ